MNIGDRFHDGELWRVLRMPDGNHIFIVSFEKTILNGVENGNRNVFRLDKDGNVIWQIIRIDYPRDWEFAHNLARERGDPGWIEPFMGFRLRFPDGTTKPGDELPPDEMDYVPGCTVELANLGIGTQWFSLDVESGVATEITPKGQRPW